ncbi:MAG: peptide deformylase [Candidatus Pacebacteria bacterium]|nr:peptide deformylase [Candidatus Paceibacterota bacterium]
MVKIVQQEAAVLRQQAQEVPVGKIVSPEIKKVLKAMSAALAKEEDGVAIAAPQIGVSMRIFVVSGRLITEEGEKLKDDLIFINPVIKSASKKKVAMDEGCLSVRWLYGKVKRADKATVEAYDEQGKKFTRHGSGLWAQIFQHEIDHLDGILFIDKASDLTEMKPEDIK